MVVHASVMSQIIREGMDDYWRAVRSKTDEGLSEIELKWKRQYEADIARWEKKLGPEFDAIFGKRRQ